MGFAKILGSIAAICLCFTATAQTRPPGWKGVVTVGVGDNCSDPTLAEAVRRLKENNTDNGYLPIIWISNTSNFFDGGTIALDNFFGEIIGGFDDCNDVTPSGYTRISGQGGARGSVFAITGGSRVWMAHLEIVEGDEYDDSDGGGIDFKGTGELNLEHMHLLYNRAGRGGGLLVKGTSSQSPLQVNIQDDVVIADNIAARNGGGIHVSGHTRLNMNKMHLALHRNRATGVNQNNVLEGGQGGGLYVEAPASAGISAAPFNGYPVFWDNQAVRGGGIMVTGGGDTSDSLVNLSTHPQGEPMMLGTNRASVAGGAIYISANSNGSYGQVCANDTIFRDNVAPDGAAVYVAPASTGLQGWFKTNDPLCGSNRYECPGNRRCSWFDRNRTEKLDGTRTDGSIIEFPGGEGDLTLHRTRLTGNIAGTLIHVGDDEFNDLWIDSTLIAGNYVSSYLIDTDANESHLRHLTIADNTIAGNHVLRLVESSNPAVASLSTFTNSIIRQPGKFALEHGGAREQTVIQYVLSNDITTLPQHDTVVAGDPSFVESNDGEYMPSTNSIAVDAAPTNIPGEEDDAFTLDLLHNPRTRDLPRGTDPSLMRDLGCYEVQQALPDQMFRNGFE